MFKHLLKKINASTVSPSLFINAVSNWLTLGVTVIVGFVITPLLVKYIGANGYGIWTLITSIVGYYGVLDLGVTSAITRYVARYMGQRDYKALNDNINTSLLLFCVIGVITISLSLVIAQPLAKFFNVPPAHALIFCHVVWIIGFTTGIGFPGNLLGAVIRAHERFLESNIVNILITIMRAVLTVFFLIHNMGLLGVAYAYANSAVANLIFNFTLCNILFSHININIKRVQVSTLGSILSFGAAAAIHSVADVMRFNLDSFVIGKWINLQSVGVFGIAALLVRYFLMFISQGTQVVLTPRFAALDGKGEKEKLRALFKKSLLITSFLSFAIGTSLTVFGSKFIVLWVGSEFIPAVPVLLILTACYTLALAQTTGISLVYALKRHYFFAKITLIEGLSNLCLSIFLAKRYGIIGVALGTAIPMLIVKIIIQPIFVSRVVDISLGSYWKQIFPPFLIAILILTANVLILRLDRYVTSFLSLFCGVILVVAIFAIFYFVRFDRIRNLSDDA